MRLALIFNKTYPGTTGIYFEHACQTLKIPYDHWDISESFKISERYDLYLRIDHGDDYTRPLPKHLHPTIFYAIDTHLPQSWRKIRHLALQFDLIFCAQRKAAQQLPNGEWIPLAYDARDLTDGFYPWPEILWDIAFVGTEGGNPRKFILQALRERYPKSSIGGAPPTKLTTIYRQAKIGFNYSIRAELNMRIFEVLGAGSLLVTNALEDSNCLIDLGLHPGVHFIAYPNLRELFACLDYWLFEEQEKERRTIASAGMQVVRQHHTYEHRLRQMLEVARQRFGLTPLSFSEDSRTNGNQEATLKR